MTPSSPTKRVRRSAACFIVAAIAISCAPAIRAAAQQSDDELQLTLPPTVYAVPGLEISLYFDNMVLTKSPTDYRFRVTCDVGKSEGSRWTVTPAKQDVGQHNLAVLVEDRNGQPVAAGSTTLHVVPESAGGATDRGIRLLIVGDSLTNASAYPNEIARLLSLPGNPKWKMLGTHKPASAKDGVAHEGYGGWTWERFVNHYEPNPDPALRKRSSPFVFLDENDKPKLNMPRYFKESCDGQTPDFVVIMLGINDCFHANPEDAASIEAKIDAVFAHADRLLAAVRAAAPQAQIGYCLTTPPNSRQAGAIARSSCVKCCVNLIQHVIIPACAESFAAN